MDEKLLTRAEAAAYLGVSLSTVYTWTRQGILEARTYGRTVRYTRESLDNPRRRARPGSDWRGAIRALLAS